MQKSDISILLNLFALATSSFMYLFTTGYYALVNSKKASLHIQISFWIIEILCVGLIIFSLLFKKFIYTHQKQLLLSAITFALGFVVIEAYFSITDLREPRFIPHPYLNYVGTPNYKSIDGLNIHNSLGFRGPEIEMPKPANRIRIITLGGSFIYGIFIKDWHNDFARKLQEKLQKTYGYKNIEVINAALPGWSSYADLLNLELRVLELKPDFVIEYVGTNDVHNRIVKPSAYKRDNTGRRQQWVKLPCLEVLCLKTVQLLTGFEAENFDTEADTFDFTASDGYSDILGMTPLEALVKNPPIYLAENLRVMAALANEYQVSLMFSTGSYSNEFPDFMKSKHYQVGLLENNETVKEIGKIKNVPVYDFAADMPKDSRYWIDGRHTNEAGADLQAKLFADFIVKHKLLDKNIAEKVSSEKNIGSELMQSGAKF